MAQQEILEDFPELELADILAVLSFAADRGHPEVLRSHSSLLNTFDTLSNFCGHTVNGGSNQLPVAILGKLIGQKAGAESLG